MKSDPWNELQKLRVNLANLRCEILQSELEETKLKKICQKLLYPFAVELLTPRESELAELLKCKPGLSNKEVGCKLNISERTVKFHVSNMLLKCQVERRADLLKALETKAFATGETA